MPTYGYQCTQCQHEFSVFQSMKDDPVSICPECGGKVKRLLYPVGIVFKGSGWYINDSRTPDASEKQEKAAEKASSEPKTETPKSDAGTTPTAATSATQSTNPSTSGSDTKSSSSSDKK